MLVDLATTQVQSMAGRPPKRQFSGCFPTVHGLTLFRPEHHTFCIASLRMAKASSPQAIRIAYINFTHNPARVLLLSNPGNTNPANPDSRKPWFLGGRNL